MSKRILAAFGIVALAVCGVSVHAARVEVAQTRAAGGVPALERAIGQELARRGGVGATVAVVQDGRVLLAKGFGRRAVDSPARVDDGTLFGIGSVTKQFTSAATLLLAEQGKLSVTDKVAKYYSDATRANDITILDLMNHV